MMDCTPGATSPSQPFLPNEITQSILSYVANDKAHSPKTRLVCQLWNTVVLELQSHELNRRSLSKFFKLSKQNYSCLTRTLSEFSQQSYAYLTQMPSISPFFLKAFFAKLSECTHQDMIANIRLLLKEWKTLSTSNPLVLKELTFSLYNHEACPKAIRFPLTEFILTEFGDAAPFPPSSEKPSEEIILETLPEFRYQEVSKEIMEEVEVGQDHQFAVNELVIVNEKGNLYRGATTLLYGVIMRPRGKNGYDIMIFHKPNGQQALVLKITRLIGKIPNNSIIKHSIPRIFKN